MKIDNSFSWARIKKAISPKIAIAVILIVAAVSAVFYVTLENSESREILIWHITDETEPCISSDTLRQVKDYATDQGIKKVILTRRHPEDRYFDAVMSTTAFYTCDIFIMNEEMALRYTDSDMFLPLSADGFDEESLLYVGNSAIGVALDDDYYLLINSKTDIDEQIIYDIFEILASN